SAPTPFPTTTTAPNPQPITFASTRLNVPMASSEKPSSSKGTVVAGIEIPPKPEEPDNCCMSGCVNCVWDLYRESLEAHTAQKLLAQQALALPPKQHPPSTSHQTLGSADGEAPRVDEREWLDNDSIPVGIRVFMATEKMLRERRRRAMERRGI
ncbi:oxidoreductase-like protein, partial [Tirmania nivea]